MTSMEDLHPSELPATLSMNPGYPHLLLNKRLWAIVACQLFVCVTSSIWLSYFFYRKLYTIGQMSWKKAVEIMGPISKRLQNLEKERAIWHCYLEWIEDYCTVYYGLLNYLNATSTDLDKLCRNKSFHAKNLSESSELINPSDRELVREEDSQYEGEVSSEVEWDKMTCSTDFKLFTAFAKTLSNMQVSTFDKGYINDDVKYVDSNSGMSWGFTSTVEEPDTGKGTTEEERSSEMSEPETKVVRKKRRKPAK